MNECEIEVYETLDELNQRMNADMIRVEEGLLSEEDFQELYGISYTDAIDMY